MPRRGCRQNSQRIIVLWSGEYRDLQVAVRQWQYPQRCNALGLKASSRRICGPWWMDCGKVAYEVSMKTCNHSTACVSEGQLRLKLKPTFIAHENLVRKVLCEIFVSIACGFLWVPPLR